MNQPPILTRVLIMFGTFEDSIEAKPPGWGAIAGPDGPHAVE